MTEELTEWHDANLELSTYLLKATVDGFEPDRDHVSGLLAKQMDALADLLWVVVGTAVLQFSPEKFKEAWRRIQTANMSKVKASRDNPSVRVGNQSDAFDVVKPAGFEPPDHTDLVSDHEVC